MPTKSGNTKWQTNTTDIQRTHALRGQNKVITHNSTTLLSHRIIKINSKYRL
jgi:hypothetical protein